MREIQKLVKSIQKELKGAEKYIVCAAEEKALGGNTDVINGYLRVAQNELDNADSLHTIVVKVIDKYRTEHGEPPEVMKQLWAYEHKEYVEWVAEIKTALETAKK